MNNNVLSNVKTKTKNIILYKRYTEFKIVCIIDKGRYNLNFKKIFSC